MDRESVSTGTEWESQAGYSRAVRVGDEVYVSGTTATDADGEIVSAGDPYRQAVRAIENVAAALREVGAEAENVVRTRIYVTDIDDWEQVGRAHAEFFGEVRPATTMAEVGRLVSPELLVEIEADAVVGSGAERYRCRAVPVPSGNGVDR